MTIIVGALCQGGIVLGADSCMTTVLPGSTASIGTAETDKIRILADGRAAFLHSGECGAGQRIAEHLGKWVRGDGQVHKKKIQEVEREFQKQMVQIFKDDVLVQLGQVLIPAGLNPVALSKSSVERLGCGIFAIEASDGVAAIQFEGVETCSHLEEGRIDFYVAGSGMMFGDSFLDFVRRVVWRSEVPSLRACMLGVYWTIQHAIRRGGSSGVGGKPNLALLSRREGKHPSFARVEGGDLEQVVTEVDDLERKIGDLPEGTVAKDEEVPTPPAAAK